MNLNRRLEPLPEFETHYSERLEILLLAAVLIVGLTFITPALSLVLGIPALVFVALVGLLYGGLAVLFRQVFSGSLIGLLITSTFAANVPLASDAYLSSIPVHLGPELQLAQVPLIVSVVLVLLIGPREVLSGTTKIEGLFAAFVGWTVLAALFGATARIETALYFSLLMFQGLLVFTLLRHAVQRDVLSFELVAQVFIGTVLAHSLFAVGQFLHGDVFGITALGEGDGISVAMVSLGPFGDFPIGTHVAGFTGMSFILGSLIVLAIPMTIMYAIRESGWRRASFLGATLVMMAILRVTGTDAGRGGLILTLVCLIAVLVYSNRATLFDLIPSRSSRTTAKGIHAKNAIVTALTTIASVAILFSPSSSTGSSSSLTNIGSKTTVIDASGGSSGGTGAANSQPELFEFVLNLSIPFFDISTIGIRLKQYVAGIDLFLQYPLFGIGGANFIYYSPEYGFQDPLPMHNIYFSLLSETGLLGLLLYSVLLCSVLWYGWKASKRSDHGLLIIGLLCGMVGYLAFGFWDVLQLIIATSFFPFWILAGAIVGEYTRTRSF